MSIDVTLTSYILNSWDGTYTPPDTSDLIVLSYASLDFTPSTSDSYKSTSGDVFKVYVAGTRIYRASDNVYASGSGFLESGDVASSSTATTLNGITATWASTADNVWTIDTTNQRVTLDVSNIAATALYGSSGKDVSFESGTTIIELKRAVQDLSTPAVDFSNASILTEQDLDNSAKNIFHVAQQAVISTDAAMLYDSGTDTYQSFQPGTTTSKRISGVATPTDTTDAANKAYSDASIVLAAGSVTAAAAEVVLAEEQVALATLWATKVDGAVSGSDFSAKAHASVEGANAPSEGSAKEWASSVDSTHSPTAGSAKEWALGGQGTSANTADGSEFAAKEYAQGQTATGGTAKQWALGGGAFVEGTVVTGSSYSAKKYATAAAAEVVLAADQVTLATDQKTLAIAQAEAAANSAAAVAAIFDNFDDTYLGTMADLVSADTGALTGASWNAGSSSIAFTGTTGTISIGQELTSTGSGYPVGANIIGSGVTTPLTISAPFTSAGSGTLNFVGSGVYGDWNVAKDGPELDNDGDTLATGMLYFNSSDNEMRIYDGTNWLAATSAGSSSLVVHKYSASGSEGPSTVIASASFTPDLSYTANNIIVFLNGVSLDSTDYTASTGTTITGLAALAASDELVIVAFKSFEVANVEGENIKSTGESDETKFLRVDGAGASWQTVDSLPDQDGKTDDLLTTNGTTTSWTNAPINLVKLAFAGQSSAPAAPSAGTLYYSSTTNMLFYWNGTAFIPVSDLASGGVITGYTSGSNYYRVHTFLISGTFLVSEEITADILMVGGGGGGSGSGNSYTGGGGGGGGGVYEITGSSAGILSVGAHAIVIGEGRGGGTGISGGGTTGDASTFVWDSSNTYSATGGGGAGSFGTVPLTTGASGGGAGNSAGGGTTGGTGTYKSDSGLPTGHLTYGNDGGNSVAYGSSSENGGGGGGGGSDGTDSSSVSVGGNGGTGRDNAWRTGSNLIYGAGGGGAGSTTAGYGGNNVTNNGAGNGGSRAAGANGLANQGGGGGGASTELSGGDRSGGTGGSGIVIIRYAI
jgi:hypothetical protein